MNLSDFKLESEAEDTYHITSKGGRRFTVHKKGLSEKAHNAIKKMCAGGGVQAYASGGDVAPMSSDSQVKASPIYDALTSRWPNPDKSFSENLVDTGSSIKDFGGKALDLLSTRWGVDGVIPPQKTEAPVQALPAAAPQQAVEALPEMAPQIQAQQDPFVQNAMSNEKVLVDQQKAVGDYMKSLGASEGASQKAWGEFNAQAGQMLTPDQIAAKYKGNDDAFMKHVMDQQIDPNRYWNSKGGGSKVLAAIGLALSGMGAGRNGTNLASEAIDKAIDHDIDSQKTDQSKNLTLWHMNRQNMQDEMSANLATRNQMLTIAQAKVAQAAASTQNAGARLQAVELLGNIEKQKSSNRMMLAAMHGAGSGTVDPANLIQAIVKNPEHQKQIAAEIDTAKTIAKNRDSIMKQFELAAKDNSILKTGGGYLREPGSVKAFKQMLLPLFKDIDGTVRQAAMDETYHNLVPGPGDTEAGQIGEKRKGLGAWLDSKSEGSLAKSYGIDLQRFPMTSSNPVLRLPPEQQQYVRWAQANPSDPRAAIVLKKVGINE